MGGHGGLNILPQKRWNVYNYENREKVRKDEEAAAREEQLKREQSRRRDAEFRLEHLRQARGLAAGSHPPAAAPTDSLPSAAPTDSLPSAAPSDSNHINLFEGLQEDFSSFASSGPSGAAGGGEEEQREGKRNPRRDDCLNKELKREFKRKREEGPAVVLPEDEKYRMGYGVAGRGVKAPWYLSRPAFAEAADESSDGRGSNGTRGGETKKRKKEAGEKKTREELREERMKREKQEKGRERALIMSARRERHGL